VKKLKSWDQPLTEAKLEETEPLMARVHTLQTDEGKELSGLQIMTHFLWLRVQPIQARVHSMWSYMGSKDPTRISKEDLPTAELEKIARQFTTLTGADTIPSSCRFAPFDKENPPHSVSFNSLQIVLRLTFHFSSLSLLKCCCMQDHVFLTCLPPFPEEGKVSHASVETEGDTPKGSVEEEIDGTNADAGSESSRSATSLSSSHSKDKKSAVKRKRSDDDDEDSSSSNTPKPKLATPTISAVPSSSHAPMNLFDLTDILSS
jgi:hypothetical protein